ncbi:MAG: FHA domain-containing protein [Planctomycetes bacterium]|nr:FHA domain-containing protein [Planctomycetota bacterium]
MQLILVDPRTGRRKSIGLDATALRLGSAVDCDVVLPDPSVAPHALTVQWTADGVVVEAIGKATFLLNERKLTAAILHVGDVVKLGTFQLVVAPSAAAARAAAVPPAAPAVAAAAVAKAAPAKAAAARDERGEEAAEDDGEAAGEEGLDEGDDEAGRAVESRGAVLAARRAQKKRVEAWIGALLIVAMGGGLAWGWRLGWFDDVRKKMGGGATPPRGDDRAAAPTDEGRDWALEPGSNELRKDVMAPALEVDPDTGETFPRDDASWRKPSSSADIDATFAKVALLLENEEFARSRWLLWKLNPQGDADVARVTARRAEVEELTKAGGAAHLAFVDELVKKGKIAPALNHCIEESIERFRGTETWYALLEKADEIEAIIDERVPEARRFAVKQKHARKRPPDLATRAPPPSKVTFAEEFSSVPRRAPAAKAPVPAAPAATAESPGRSPSDGAGTEAGSGAAAGSAAGAAAGAPSAASTAEQQAAATALTAAFAALDGAKAGAFAARLEELVAAAGRFEGAALPAVRARLDALAVELESAPEKAALADLRAKCLELRAAREAALAFIFDASRYFMLDPKSSGALGQVDELAAAQKEVERLVEGVRDHYGSELGGAPGPIVSLSERYARRVAEVQALDQWLAGRKQALNDRAELLATRLLPPGTTKVHVRNYALDVDERARLDRDRELRAAMQRLRGVPSEALELLAAVNTYRELLGRSPLAHDGALANSAAVAVAQRAKEAKGQKESDPQPLPDAGGTTGAVNYLRGRFSARQAVAAWCKIAGAHRHLLDADHRALGSAVEPKYWVAKFGRFVPAGS